MIVYNFQKAAHALENIRLRRLKVSEVAKLNDPFEFLAADMQRKEHRELLRQFKRGFWADRGIICFSRNWHNPVQWSHYADKHQGICLGFDISPNLLTQVNYVASRFPWPDLSWPWPDEVGKAFITKLISTKFSHWSYEDEYRLFCTRRPEPGEELAFYRFSKDVSLAKVLIGAKCETTPDQVFDALGEQVDSVDVFKVRAAFRSFRVVKNQNKKYWVWPPQR